MEVIYMKKFITNKKVIITFVCCLVVIVLVFIGVTAMNMVAKNSSIGVNAAKRFALIDAGVKEKNINDIDIKFTYKDSTYVYDVKFDTKKKNYRYYVKASNGIILEKKISKKASFKKAKKKAKKKSKSKKKKTKSNKSNNSSKAKPIKEAKKKTKSKNNDDEEDVDLIGIDEAKSIAINAEGADFSEAVFTKARLARSNGKDIYQIVFYDDDTEYHCTIDARTGNVIEAYTNGIHGELDDR